MGNCLTGTCDEHKVVLDMIEERKLNWRIMDILKELA